MSLKKSFITIVFFSLSLIYIGCSTAKEEKTPPPKNPIPKPAIAPGTASVSAKILSITETDGKFTCNVSIIKVNEYGMNANSVAEGSNLTLDVAENLKDNNLLKVGKTVEILLKSPGDTLEGSVTPNWKLINIK